MNKLMKSTKFLANTGARGCMRHKLGKNNKDQVDERKVLLLTMSDQIRNLKVGFGNDDATKIRLYI